jgi:hypothetical protein
MQGDAGGTLRSDFLPFSEQVRANGLTSLALFDVTMGRVVGHIMLRLKRCDQQTERQRKLSGRDQVSITVFSRLSASLAKDSS